MMFQNFCKTFSLIIFGCSVLNSNSQISIKKINESSYSINFNDSISSLIDSARIDEAIGLIHKKSIKLYLDKNYDKGLEYVLWEKDLYEKNNIQNKNYSIVLYNLGLFSYKNHEYLKAANYFEEFLDKNTYDYKIGKAYMELGRLYRLTGRNQKSIEYLNKSINHFHGTGNLSSELSAHINLSGTFASINTREYLIKALNALKNAELISNKYSIDKKRRIDINRALATLYGHPYLLDFHKSQFYYKKALRLSLKINDFRTIAILYNNLAYNYNMIKSDSSKYYIEKGFRYADFPEIKARLNDNMADYYLLNRNYENALSSINKSLKIVTRSDLNFSAPEGLKKSILKDYTLYCFKKKSEIYLEMFHRDRNNQFLIESLKNIELAEYVVDILLNGTNNESTQMLWRRAASQAYLYGAYASHLLGDPDKAFEYMEKNKALLLSESILKNTEFANLPKHISDEETRRKKRIYSLEEKLNKDSENVILQDSLFLAKRSQEKYIDSLKLLYPKYFARKIDVEQLSLKKIKEEISEKQAVVSYLWNNYDRDKELIVGLVSTKTSSKSFIIEDVNKLKILLSDFQKLVSKPLETKQDQNDFQEVAYQLYYQLFPEEVKSLISGKDLVIISDGLLQNIPFESLITKKNTNEYLLLSNNIHYSYSYSFLKHNDKVSRVSKNSLIGYSPISFKDSSLISLKNSEEEIEKIGKYFNGVIKQNDNATKKDFLDNSSDSKIIHLATHADASESPWIAFSDSKLNLNELYTYKNNAELVVLSACSTSLGEIAQGEGVISLARGFFHSGSKSVISSLWRVNDKSTTDIMNIFYNNLSKGQTKSIALNNAKREYLSSHSLSDQSPYYWSSFVLIGDAGEIDLPSNNYLLYGSVLLLIPLGLFIQKKFKKAG